MSVQRAFLNWFSADPRASRNFYTQLLGYRITFESDWFIQLNVPGKPGESAAELGILRRDENLIPENDRTAPRGVMLTVVVPDVDVIHARARELGAEIVEAPRNLFYGQRRLLLRDPDGGLVDVSAECEPDPDWMARVRQDETGVFREAPPE